MGECAGDSGSTRARRAREGLKREVLGDTKHGGRVICLKTTRGSWTCTTAFRPANSLFALERSCDEKKKGNNGKQTKPTLVARLQVRNELTSARLTGHYSPGCESSRVNIQHLLHSEKSKTKQKTLQQIGLNKMLKPRTLAGPVHIIFGHGGSLKAELTPVCCDITKGWFFFQEINNRPQTNQTRVKWVEFRNLSFWNNCTHSTSHTQSKVSKKEHGFNIHDWILNYWRVWMCVSVCGCVRVCAPSSGSPLMRHWLTVTM